MNRFATIAAACALALVGSVQAADTDTTYSDQMFFTNAAIGGMAEVDAGKLASAPLKEPTGVRTAETMTIGSLVVLMGNSF